MLVLFDVTCIAFLLALVLTPGIRNVANRFGLVDRPDLDRKQHLGSIPRLGGIAVAVAYTSALAFIAVAPYRSLNLDIRSGISAALRLAPAAAVVFLVGLVDDLRGLRAWQKLIGEALAAVFAYEAGFGVYVLRGHPVSDWISLPLTMVWLVGCINALNLIDGMDGLAAGVGVFAALTSFVAALVHNSLDLAFVTAPLAGALLGFLRYNFNPASIFLGDCGSLLIGFLLGCFGIIWSEKSATVLGMTAPLIAFAIPLGDVALAVVRRFLRRQPILMGDRAHIHHRLLDRGFTPRRAALMLYAVCGLAAALALLTDIAQDKLGGLVVILFCAAAWIGVQHLGYAELGIAGRMALRGSFRNMVGAQLALQRFERALHSTLTFDQAWETIVEGAREFNFSGVQLQLGDHLFRSAPPAAFAGHWQVRAPLGDEQSLVVYRDPAQEVHPLALASFPKEIERFLNSRSPALDEVRCGSEDRGAAAAV
jgi:UDP-GlcNAc:undecaprenyl-phosphate/decaprenyl-phosphate GlcNAc-1-phosphate transferase